MSMPEYGRNVDVCEFEFCPSKWRVFAAQIHSPWPKIGQKIRSLKIADFMLLS